MNTTIFNIIFFLDHFFKHIFYAISRITLSCSFRSVISVRFTHTVFLRLHSSPVPWHQELTFLVEYAEELIRGLVTVASEEVVFQGYRSFLCLHNKNFLLFCFSTRLIRMKYSQ